MVDPVHAINILKEVEFFEAILWWPFKALEEVLSLKSK